MNIDIEIVEHNSVIKVSVRGEIDVYTAPKLREILFPLAEKENANIIVNLSDVIYMDSTGLGVFVGVFKSVRSNNGKFQLVGLSGRIKRLFEITGLAEIMDINSRMEGESL
ncbi:anti-sigma factor antagonist [Bacillus dakarensis]|uniref:anti-sigma factor antagonist n=1 Tax=Robertmurraya dakarensis TaxID=1926278 RepID=UPI0009818A88|nr:anti-sigma factor antagonist [Bacillus dakarensis]